MQVLVILGSNAAVDKTTVANTIGEELYTNTIPKGDGIAFFDCGKEPDWSWPEYVVVVGQCNVGRHHVDLSLPSDEETTSDIVEALLTISESLNGSDASGIDSYD